MYASEQMAEDALIEAQIRFDYHNQGPIAVYKCEDCGHYHLTSRGPMNPRLAQLTAEGKIKLEKEANKWLHKFKK